MELLGDMGHVVRLETVLILICLEMLVRCTVCARWYS
jgi:hypothetical protein